MEKSNEGKKGMVFDIQRYSLHDGKGIRTVVFLKGCPLRCQWCCNPESQKQEQEFIFSADECMECKKYSDVCPPGKNIDNNEFKLYKECADYCPTGALEIVGEKMSVGEVIGKVKKDRNFYKNSNGGVTISGGEPLQQWKFTAELIKELKRKYFNVTMETSGYASWDHFKEIARLCDLILYDLKHMDNQMHKKYTGLGNEVVLANARKIAEQDKKLIFRVPLIGGVNDTEDNIQAVANFAQELGVKEVHFLPYHRLGESKYKSLRREYNCQAFTPEEERIEELKKIVTSKSLTVKIGG